ncbi:MAG: PEP-CTERM sorting domain-containing protein [Coleofasciculaceae cyanobacterium SM2_3_26]|nr:PEP-CTERM sorting domain-containing protein [Coleofasciculaceae cyanobacterium SM2_3_26]
MWKQIGTAVAIAATSIGGTAIVTTPAGAYSIFFGENINNTDPRVPLEAFPNASQAETNFLSRLVGVGTEDFESFPVGTDEPLALDFGAAGVATLNGEGSIETAATPDERTFSRYAISGENYWRANAGGNQFSIDFSQEVAAFGFYGVDLGDFGGELELVLTLASGGKQTLKVPNTVGSRGDIDGSVLFYGLIAESENEVFTSLSFNLTAPDTGALEDVFAFDDLTIGSLEQVVDPPNVPEPSTVAGILALGLLGLGQLRKRFP